MFVSTGIKYSHFTVLINVFALVNSDILLERKTQVRLKSYNLRKNLRLNISTSFSTNYLLSLFSKKTFNILPAGKILNVLFMHIWFMTEGIYPFHKKKQLIANIFKEKLPNYGNNQNLRFRVYNQIT